ncbi:MAG: autotransporter outer membrane beta-barrel domain-containing protein [Chlamydiota bacterium]
MKRAIVVLGMFFASMLQAEEACFLTKGFEPECTHFPYENRIVLRPILSYLSIRYRKDVPSANLPQKYAGMVGGGEVLYERDSYGGLYAFLESRILSGKLAQDEPDQGRDARVFDALAKGCLGCSYLALQGNRLRVSPYVGLGFSYFQEKGDDLFPYGENQYLTILLPVGFRLSYRAMDTISLGFRFEWLPDLDTTTQMGEERNLRYVLATKTNQLFVELPVEFFWAEIFSLEITPFWERRKTGNFAGEFASRSIPSTMRTYWGGKLGLAFLF